MADFIAAKVVNFETYCGAVSRPLPVRYLCCVNPIIAHLSMGHQVTKEAYLDY